MADVSGFPYLEVQFDKDGNIFGPDDGPKAADFVAENGLTDLFVPSHGWNNDMQEARDLYRNFFASVRAVLDHEFPALSGRRFGVLAVLWPSKKFADADLIPSGAAGANAPLGDEAVTQHLDHLKGVFDAPGADAALERAKSLVPELDDSPQARRQFVDLVRSALTRRGGDHEDAASESDLFFTRDGDAILNKLKQPILPTAAPAAGGPKPPRGGAAGIVGDLAGGVQAGVSKVVGGVRAGLSGMRAGADRLLNFATYYQMKERAGLVGRTGVYQVLRAIRGRHSGAKVHLIGHSFGGRLVTSAALGPDGPGPIRPESMTLLQAAFSHHGFASRFDGANDGSFRAVVADRRISGPILITHSVQDEAVGIAYPLASRIAGQDASALGDANDRYGGIGRNGAQKTAEAVPGTLLPVGGAYTFSAGKVFNLNADRVITGHSDICKPQVAYALLAAVATT
ncbi:MAG TPA: hypothetical protein VKP69_21505 [Isosphaeraceae bacterium]|nr:hypothetical protein [Isosphaeraceae bacterium]